MELCCAAGLQSAAAAAGAGSLWDSGEWWMLLAAQSMAVRPPAVSELKTLNPVTELNSDSKTLDTYFPYTPLRSAYALGQS